MQSDTLRLLRVAKNLKQKVIADLLGMSQANYSNLENGKTKINSDAAKKLAEYYGVGMDVFFLPHPPATNTSIAVHPQFINQSVSFFEANETLLDPILERMELLLNILSDEKEELTNERRQIAAVLEKLANKFDTRL
jgi:transcriptional regulator with XRE-family HTH domain